MVKTPKAKPKPKGKSGRPPAVEIKAGMLFGHLRIKMRVNTKEGPRFITECEAPKVGGPYGMCGKRERVPHAYLVRPLNPKRHCGCQLYIDANPFPREKGIFSMMHQRCENVTHVSYHHYGGANPPVKIHPDFHKSNPEGWNNFIKEVGPAPSKKHTLDRINPFKGYEPGNLRWATMKEQMNNQRHNTKSVAPVKS